MGYCPLCGYEIPEESNTSVLHWTRYDGTMETLPGREQGVLIVKECNDWESQEASISVDYKDWENRLAKCSLYTVEIGDMWAYLPNMETVIES